MLQAKKILLMTLAVVAGSWMTFSCNAQPSNTKNNNEKNIKSTTKMDGNNQKEGIRIRMKTDMGNIVIRLYNETPLHRDNFVALVNNGFYDSLMFHRVIPSFMIQGGDPNSKNVAAGQMLGSGGGDMERIPAEFRPNLFHKKGALAAARDGNPQKASSACQFYLVQGKKYSAEELGMMESQMSRKFSKEEREAYINVGGTPFLDQNYTVFGEIESGSEVIDAIAAAPRNAQDRPLTDIRMYMEVIR